MSHTTSDFDVRDSAHDAAAAYARRAANLALDGYLTVAILEYRAAIDLYRKSTLSSAAERIAFAEGEIARFEMALSERGGR